MAPGSPGRAPVVGWESAERRAVSDARPCRCCAGGSATGPSQRQPRDGPPKSDRWYSGPARAGQTGKEAHLRAPPADSAVGRVPPGGALPSPPSGVPRRLRRRERGRVVRCARGASRRLRRRACPFRRVSFGRAPPTPPSGAGPGRRMRTAGATPFATVRCRSHRGRRRSPRARRRWLRCDADRSGTDGDHTEADLVSQAHASCGPWAHQGRWPIGWSR